MAEAPRLLTGQPLFAARRPRDHAVRADSQFQRHQRPLFHHPQEEPRVQRRGFRRQQAHINGKPCIPQHRDAPAGNARVRVFHRSHHARDAGGDQCTGTRRRAAVMGTGLQRDIGRGPARRVTGTGQRHGLGMGPPAFLRTAAANDDPVPHDHTAHRRVGRHLPQSPPRQPQGMLHVNAIGPHHSVLSSPPPRAGEVPIEAAGCRWAEGACNAAQTASRTVSRFL